MSKIQTEVLNVTELKAKSGEDRQDFLKRVMTAVGKLSDADWDDLSKDAQDWFNEAADANNAKKKTLPDFPDFKEEPADEPKTTRRRSSGDAEAPAKPKVGVVAKITTKRGKTATGTIVEMDDEMVVIKHGDGSEEEFDRSRVESIEVAGGGAKAKDDEPEADKPLPVGAMVTLVTKRGKEVKGKIVEMDDEVIVLDVDGKDEEFARDRVETIKPQDTEAKSSRRSSAKDEDKAEPKGEEKKARASNEAGVSVGTRIKELIADDLEASEADIRKALDKEGIKYSDNTLKLNYTDAHKFVDILVARKMLKK